MWLTLVVAVAALTAGGPCPCRGCSAQRTVVQKPGFETVTSANFSVRSLDRRISAAAIAQRCEALRTHLYWHWQDDLQPADWSLRCEIVIHATLASYTAAVGRGSEQTFGSAWLNNQAGKCFGRRIDLLADGAGELSALPHELTHVVIASMLGNRVPPRWLDEGIALLADSDSKQDLHERDLLHARNRQLTFRVGELLSLDRYPEPARVPAFYAQSGSLAAFLAKRDGKPSSLLKFAAVVLDGGHDEALRSVYAIDGAAALERAWLAESRFEIAYRLK